MKYYNVDLGGLPTLAKTELTTRFQTVHDYYMGCDPDGGGPDQHADHHIVLRTASEDDLNQVLKEIFETHRAKPSLREADPDEPAHGGGLTYRERFTRDYETEASTPTPFTFTPYEDDANE